MKKRGSVYSPTLAKYSRAVDSLGLNRQAGGLHPAHPVAEQDQQK